jgi:hydrogenase maturation protein HypF
VPGARRRLGARVEGVVQGVGFRPHAHRLATELGLAGFVLNDERGVLLEVEGEPAAVERFLERLRSEAPPLARIERVVTRALEPSGEAGFAIRGSRRAAVAEARVSADGATCDDCLAELWDPADRRHRYPFVNCTNCGPRFTIVEGVPYDRALTTMAGFEMCERCRAEYDDPADRRFHAQPNACPACGPSLRLVPPGGEPLAEAAAALRAGRIVAVKGLGGYHLACLAADEAAVAALRSRKRREDRPFALMAPSLDTARELVELTAADERLLRGRERPIVIARRRADAAVAPSAAPGSADLGVMLPYSPLHHLLLADTGATLVMTSGNVSDEPIAYDDADALGRLRTIADLFVAHDRPIHVRTDDSVVRSTARGPLLLRRSRGYVPGSLALPLEAPPLLACGAELKSTLCVARGRSAWVSHHIGDLRNWETLRSFRAAAEHFERLFEVRPELVAHDLHPDYLSTAYALGRERVGRVAVQHHHAHLAACLAEHGETGPAVGAIYDGTGHGTDGTVWGGELLVGDLAGFERAGMLLPVRQPGGDRAAAEPWRMACAWLVAAGEGDEPLAGVEERRWRAVADMALTGTASPLTSSIGRLFDAVAALCGVRLEATYEGQAAAELEALSDPGERGAYELPLSGSAPLVVDARPAVLAAARDLRAGHGPGAVGARFHNGLAAATAAAVAAAASERGLGTAVLSGGVFQNRVLLERTAAALERAGLRVLAPAALPPNDGGIAFGQAAVAAATAAAVA